MAQQVHLVNFALPDMTTGSVSFKSRSLTQKPGLTSTNATSAGTDERLFADVIVSISKVFVRSGRSWLSLCILSAKRYFATSCLSS
jgi:hypothetical protein